MSIKLPYKPREWQLEAQKQLNRFTVLVLHRRAGKTVFDVMQSIIAVLSCKLARPQAAFIAPTYSQAKKVAWDYYKEYLEPLRLKGLVTFNESSLRIDFKNGGKIYLLGSEEPDAIRGMYMDHVVLDEYQMMPADFFEKVIRPLLSDREGKAILTGTPSGRNHFYTAYSRAMEEDNKDWSGVLKTWDDTQVLRYEEIEAAKRDMSEEAFQQEYECSFDASVKGSFFGRNLTRMRMENRLIKVNHDPASPVVTGWDIGFDGTAIWYVQKQGGRFVLIDLDYYENEDLTYGANLVLNKPYTYAYQILPHDGNDRNIMDKKRTPKGQLENLGLKCKIAGKVGLMSAINSGRMLLDKCCMSQDVAEKKLKLGSSKIAAIDALALYEANEDAKQGILKTTEKHNRYSHIGSALRTLAEGLKENILNSSSNFTVLDNKKRPTVLVQNKWNPFKKK